MRSISFFSSRSSSSCSSSSCATSPVRDSSGPSTTPPQRPVGHSSQSGFDTSPSSNAQALKSALDKTDSLLNPPPDADDRDVKGNGATVTANASNVERDSNTNPKSTRYKHALALVQAHSALEAQQLASLPPQERARYSTVKHALLSSANNPVAALALQKLLFSGRLQSGQDLLGTGSVLEHLSSIARGHNLHSRVDQHTLLTSLVQELATPSAINQGGRGTCAPTSLCIALARDNPAEYARILKHLASPKGEVKLAGGNTLDRQGDTSFKDDGSRRALTQRLLAPAFMEVANGERDYLDSAKKGERNASASAAGLDILYDMVYGRDMKYDPKVTDAERADAMRLIEKELANGQTVMAGLKYISKWHKLLVTGIQKDGDTHYVQYINPWGREERMTREEFQSRLHNYNYDPSTAAAHKPTVPAPSQPSRPVEPPKVSVRVSSGVRISIKHHLRMSIAG